MLPRGILLLLLQSKIRPFCWHVKITLKNLSRVGFSLPPQGLNRNLISEIPWLSITQEGFSMTNSYTVLHISVVYYIQHTDQPSQKIPLHLNHPFPSAYSCPSQPVNMPLSSLTPVPPNQFIMSTKHPKLLPQWVFIFTKQCWLKDYPWQHNVRNL